jgi:1,4-dihydroxy-2-naphthoate polyprenyltransferase
MPAAAVLVVNNYRDIENDRRAGRRTFAVVFGARASRVEYADADAAALPAAAAARGWAGAGLAAAGCWPLPWAWCSCGVSRSREPAGPAFNELLADTARLQLAFGALLCAGLFAGGLRG